MEQQMATQNKLNGTFGENSMLSQDVFFLFTLLSLFHTYITVSSLSFYGTSVCVTVWICIYLYFLCLFFASFSLVCFLPIPVLSLLYFRIIFKMHICFLMVGKWRVWIWVGMEVTWKFLPDLKISRLYNTFGKRNLNLYMRPIQDFERLLAHNFANLGLYILQALMPTSKTLPLIEHSVFLCHRDQR